MSVSSIARCAGLVVCALTYAAPALAQREAVPRELVDVLWLLERNSGSGAVLHVGSVPARLRGITDGAGVRVIGAVERGSLITTAVAIRADAPAAVAEWNRRLGQNGWALQPARVLPQQTGFVSSRPPGTDGEFRVFCSSADNGAITVRLIEAPRGETYIVSSYTGGGTQPNRCTSPAPAPGLGRLRNELLPSLAPPPGATVINQGGGSSTGEADARATLVTDLSAAALVDHYGREMNSQGWTAVERSAGNSSALSVWRKDSASAPALFGWLSALQLPDGSRSMQVRVMTIANRAVIRP